MALSMGTQCLGALYMIPTQHPARWVAGYRALLYPCDAFPRGGDSTRIEAPPVLSTVKPGHFNTITYHSDAFRSGFGTHSDRLPTLRARGGRGEQRWGLGVRSAINKLVDSDGTGRGYDPRLGVIDRDRPDQRAY